MVVQWDDDGNGVLDFNEIKTAISSTALRQTCSLLMLRGGVGVARAAATA